MRKEEFEALYYSMYGRIISHNALPFIYNLPSDPSQPVDIISFHIRLNCIVLHLVALHVYHVITRKQSKRYNELV